jgi:hypothetical protein
MCATCSYPGNSDGFHFISQLQHHNPEFRMTQRKKVCTIATFLGSATYAPINRSGAQVHCSENGFCPVHPSIQLRKKQWCGCRGWKTVEEFCPGCEWLFQWLLEDGEISPVHGQEPQQNNSK